MMKDKINKLHALLAAIDDVKEDIINSIACSVTLFMAEQVNGKEGESDTVVKIAFNVNDEPAIFAFETVEGKEPETWFVSLAIDNKPIIGFNLTEEDFGQGCIDNEAADVVIDSIKRELKRTTLNPLFFDLYPQVGNEDLAQLLSNLENVLSDFNLIVSFNQEGNNVIIFVYDDESKKTLAVTNLILPVGEAVSDFLIPAIVVELARAAVFSLFDRKDKVIDEV